MNVQFNLIRLVLISFGIFISSHLISQNAPITTAGSGSVCPGGAISIPITVTNFNQITAISLQIDFNPILINYSGYTNLNSAISSSFVNEVSISPTLKKIMIVWSDVTPLNLTNGSKLLDLNFTLLSGSPVLTFNNTENGGGNCEYANAT
ncbi:MAG: cohesin domain-containing protein, partial [Bacteroidales bacterium]